MSVKQKGWEKIWIHRLPKWLRGLLVAGILFANPVYVGSRKEGEDFRRWLYQ